MKTRDLHNAVLGASAPAAAGKNGDPAWRVVDENLPSLIRWGKAGHQNHWRCAPVRGMVVQVCSLPAFIHDTLLGREPAFIRDVTKEFDRARTVLTNYNWRREKLEKEGRTADEAARFMTGRHHAWAALLEPLDWATIYSLSDAVRRCRHFLRLNGHTLACGRN